MLSTEDVRGLDGWREKRSEGTGRKEGAVVVGACVYIRERGERVEDAQSVNRNARTRTLPRPPRPRFLLPAPPPSLPLPPSPPGKIPSLIPNKVSGQLRELESLGAWELRGRAAQPSIIQSIPPPLRLSSFFLLFLLLVSPETLPCLGSEPVCLFVCLSTLLTCLPSHLVLSCPVLSCASCFILFSISWPPTPTSSALPPSSLP